MWPARQGESVSRTSHLGFVLAYVLKQASRVIGDRADPSARFEPQGQDAVLPSRSGTAPRKNQRLTAGVASHMKGVSAGYFPT